ncbi:MAG: DMT family transporter [Bosea sp. (in: a-proteobacteria)]
MLLRLAPILFVLIWSTGWVVAGLAAPYADPLTFLSVRYAVAAVAMAGIALALKAAWPLSRADYGHALVSGVLLHAIYLGGVWWAVRHGLPAGISGLIAALQPILTALLAPALLAERISTRQWAGVGLGFLGIALVLQPKLAGVAPGVMGAVLLPILVNIVSMISVTAGTFYQKRFIATGDLRTVTTLQYVGALLVTLPVAYLLEPMVIQWNGTMVFVLAWSVLALSLGAIGLYLMLIRKGEVSRAATLIYLIPPTVAVQAWLFFGETLGAIQLIGMAVTVAGVALATRR